MALVVRRRGGGPISWPHTESQQILAYTTLFVLTMTVAGWFVHPALAYATVLAWAAGWLWDVALRAVVFPERDLSPEERTRLQFQQGLQAQRGAGFERIEKRIAKLEQRLEGRDD